jgi:hypothetical protein
MHPRDTDNVLKSMKNTMRAAASEAVAVCTLSENDIENGYVTASEFSKKSDATGAQSPLSESPTHLNGEHATTTLTRGYAQADYTPTSTGYIIPAAPTALTGYINVASFQISEVSQENKQLADEIIAARALEEAVAKHNKALIAILHANGFINGVNITSGITAHIAIFEYIGNDPDVLALTRHGYVIVKLPPYIPAEKSIRQLHAEQTYNNEFNMINQIANVDSDTRPKLLAKHLDGQAFIFNSAIFHDEERFLALRHAALNNQIQTISPKYYNSDSECEDEEDDFVNNHVYDPRIALEGILQQAFQNLGTFMRMLAITNQDPTEIFDDIFSSMFQALQELHDQGFVHLDLADRNFVTQIIKKMIKVFLVDFGTTDTFCKKTGKSTRNQKYPETPIMHDATAMQLDDYTLSVCSDYVSLQKTMLQVIADYCKVDFYKLMIKGLPNAPKIPNIEFLRLFTDRQLIDQAKNNLIKVANVLISKNDGRGAFALSVIEKYTPFFNHDYNPNDNYEALRAAHEASFRECLVVAAEVDAPLSPQRPITDAYQRFGLMSNQNDASEGNATSPRFSVNSNN